MALPQFQRFLDDHSAEVHRFLVGQVGRNEADDCFQETFLSALRAYPRLEAGSNLRAWVFTIARRKAVDAHRVRGRRAAPSEAVVDTGDPQSDAAFDRVLDADPALWAEVDRLPVKQRAAVVLRHVNDLAHAEIGEVLGCSEEAARRSVHEGVKRLRRATKLAQLAPTTRAARR